MYGHDLENVPVLFFNPLIYLDLKRTEGLLFSLLATAVLRTSVIDPNGSLAASPPNQARVPLLNYYSCIEMIECGVAARMV